jgi:hypothetical protein
MNESSRTQARRAELERNLLELQRAQKNTQSFATWLEGLYEDSYSIGREDALELLTIYGEFA